MGFGATPLGELGLEINAAIEVQGAIIVEVNVERLVVGRSVDETDIASLKEVVGDNNMLLIRRNLDEVGPDRRLNLVRIVETDGVVDV